MGYIFSKIKTEKITDTSPGGRIEEKSGDYYHIYENGEHVGEHGNLGTVREYMRENCQKGTNWEIRRVRKDIKSYDISDKDYYHASNIFDDCYCLFLAKLIDDEDVKCGSCRRGEDKIYNASPSKISSHYNRQFR